MTTTKTLAVLHDDPESFEAVLPPPDAATYFRASDKVRLFEACSSLEVAVPAGIVVPGGRLPEPGALEALGKPFVVRPARSWRLDGDRWVHGAVSWANERDALAARVRLDPALAFPYLVQERIVGPGCGLFVNADGGRITRLFAHRRLREKPPWGGVSSPQI